MVSKEQILKAARLIQQGKVVAFPTDTVYGLGADALNPLAVLRIFELKQRPKFDPLIVHIADLSDLQRLTTDLDRRVNALAARFWPGPLTIILPKSEIVPDIVTAGLSTVGIRMPNNKIALELIKLSGCPIAAPSANKFGYLSPTEAVHVRKHLAGADFILDGGKTEIGIESTIIKLNGQGFEIVRNGFITKDELQEIIPYHPGTDKAELLAPGMLESHYCPSKPLFIINETITAENLQKIKPEAALLAFSAQNDQDYKKVLLLTTNESLKEYAANLFSALHKIEQLDVSYTVVQPVPETGLGIAIMERLRKAAFKYKNFSFLF